MTPPDIFQLSYNDTPWNKMTQNLKWISSHLKNRGQSFFINRLWLPRYFLATNNDSPKKYTQNKETIAECKNIQYIYDMIWMIIVCMFPIKGLSAHF